MNFTINTDASFCPHTKQGGYAYWITSNLGRTKGYGKFKTRTKNSTEAEIKAIANAIHSLRLSNVKVGHLYINTDSTGAIKKIKDFIHTFNKDTLMVESILNDLYIIFNLPKTKYSRIKMSKLCKLRHVKAHNYNGTTRSYVNEWCDKYAKIGKNK